MQIDALEHAKELAEHEAVTQRRLCEQVTRSKVGGIRMGRAMVAGWPGQSCGWMQCDAKARGRAVGAGCRRLLGGDITRQRRL